MAQKTLISLEVNGARHEIAVRPFDVLLDVLRDTINLTGSKRGCDMGTCGCCTVLIDGVPRLSCLTLALDAVGTSITTVEGLKDGAALHPLQKAWATTGGSQCGFCTPGFLMTSKALLDANPHPTDPEIRHALSGNLCRCTGYVKIVEAVKRAAAELAGVPVGDAAEGPRAGSGGGAPGACTEEAP
jgi:aerobic-type carbon monoxide dehydrogenase small subunit (CoxS/CutS family)